MNSMMRVMFSTLIVVSFFFLPTSAKSADDSAFLSGKTKIERHDYAGAIADFSSFIEREGKDVAAAYHGRGMAKMKLGDRPGAVADFMKVIDLEPQLAPDFLDGKHEDVDRGGESRSGNDFSTRVFQSDLVPGYAFAFDNRGLLKYIQGNYEGAIDDFTMAIALEPKFSLPYKHRGYAKYDLQDYQGAIDDYTKAIKYNRKSAEIYRERALAKEQSGDEDGAMDDYRRAAKLGDAAAMHKLAEKEKVGVSIK
jgi:tetratricopeptide (TPR) repeat protein